ncbi:MAG: hypothetical protein KAG61_01230 [Bacteriovoracaceae bacterium]|nr:hypothetical protein [Bacteriovoracaceae bacterium]
MSQVSAGKDILSYCNKCKMALSHTITVMKDINTVGKVMCNTCKGVHAYKDPNAAAKKATRKKSTSPGRKSASAKAELLENKWQADVMGSKNEPQKYSPKSQFVIGDIIDHPKFGMGVVEATMEADKLDILFQTGNKILVHNK